jgi:hypothetical protein
MHVFVTAKTKIPEWLNNGSNVSIVNVSDDETCNAQGKFTFREFFEYANDNVQLEKDGIVCLCNSDIFLDHNSNWFEARKLIDQNIVLALSRHEFDGINSAKKDDNLQKVAYAHVHDAWMFKTPFVIRDCNFQMKEISTFIADRIRNSGYTPVNSPNQFKIFHYFVQKSNQQQSKTPDSQHLKERGYYLVPDIEAIDSIDSLVKNMGLGTIDKYKIICDVLTRHMTT